LQRIAALFQIEAEINGHRAKQRHVIRQERMPPRLPDLKDFITAALTRLSRKSTLAVAIRPEVIKYALAVVNTCTRFDFGSLPRSRGFFGERQNDGVARRIDVQADHVRVQALDRTQPGLPMKPGRAGTPTHDDKRNGTTTRFAALNVLDGTVVGRCMQRHRHQELLRFLNAIERQAPVGKVIHVILDNYAAHKHPNVRKWLARHPRWVFHFTPTSCSWLNAVEGFFAKLTRRRLKRGVFPSLVALQEAINRFIEHHNHAPRPFTWKADPKAIIAAAKRGHQTLETIH
jgi:transposase